MANSTEMSVAVERAIHDVMRDVAQKISDQHGVRVNDVYFDWNESPAGEKMYVYVAKVRVSSETT